MRGPNNWNGSGVEDNLKNSIYAMYKEKGGLKQRHENSLSRSSCLQNRRRWMYTAKGCLESALQTEAGFWLLLQVGLFYISSDSRT